MTRIPHESPELESWLSKAKQADRALAPGPAELDKLGARLSPVHAGTALKGSALLSAPVAKVAAAASAVVLAGGMAMTLGPLAQQTAPSKPAAVEDPVPVPRQVQTPPLPAPRTVPARELSLPDLPISEPKSRPTVAPTSRRHAELEPMTWTQVNDALTQGNLPAARGALENFIAREDGAKKERAELALAQLEMGGPGAARAQAILRRLATSAVEPSVRRRAQSLLAPRL